jgi:hypothetical protein
MHVMGGSSAELRLPMLSVAVELARAGRPPERVELFISDAAARSRAQVAGEIAELLERDTQFLPVREPDAPGGPRVALVGKRAIAWVSIPLAGEPDADEALYDHDHDVVLELDAGAALAGHVLYSSPADRPRLADYLNQEVHFLRLWTPEALVLVNKHHVVRVVELS